MRPNWLGFVVLLTALTFVGSSTSAHAAVQVFGLDSTYSGTSPAGTAPWVTVTIDDFDSSGLVSLKIENTGLTGTEFVDKLYLNLEPSLNPALLDFTETSSVGSANYSIWKAADAWKAGPDGLFDILVDFDNSNANAGAHRFGVGESITFDVDGISSLTAASFNFPSVDDGKGTDKGGLFAAAHINSIGRAGALSGWIADGNGGAAVIPEPSSLAVWALLGLAAVIARRRRSRAA